MVTEEASRVGDGRVCRTSKSLIVVILVVSVSDGCTAETGTIIFIKDGIGGAGGDGLACHHVTKFGTAAVKIHVAVVNGDVNISCNWGLGRCAATKKPAYPCVVYFCCQIYISVSTGGLSWLFHICSKKLVNLSASAPEIDVWTYCCSFAESCHEALLYLASCHVDGAQNSPIIVCAMTSRIEFLDVRVASYLIVFHFVASSLARPYHLCEIASIDDATVITGVVVTGIKVVGIKLELVHFRQTCLCHLEPSTWFPDGDTRIESAIVDA